MSVSILYIYNKNIYEYTCNMYNNLHNTYFWIAGMLVEILIHHIALSLYTTRKKENGKYNKKLIYSMVLILAGTS